MASWQQFHEQGTTALRKRKYQVAKNHFAQALKIAKQQDDLANVAKSHFQLGLCHMVQNNISEAERSFREVLSMGGAIEESAPNLFATASCNIATAILMRGGSEHEAMEVLQAALEKIKKSACVELPFANVYRLMGELKSNIGHFFEAETFFRQAIDIQVKTIGRDHELTQATLADLLKLLLLQNRLGDSVSAVELFASEDNVEFLRRSKQVAKGINSSPAYRVPIAATIY